MRKYTIQYTMSSVPHMITVCASSQIVAIRRFWENLDYAPIAPNGKAMWTRRSIRIIGYTSVRLAPRVRRVKKDVMYPMAAAA